MRKVTLVLLAGISSFVFAGPSNPPANPARWTRPNVRHYVSFEEGISFSVKSQDGSVTGQTNPGPATGGSGQGSGARGRRSGDAYVGIEVDIANSKEIREMQLAGKREKELNEFGEKVGQQLNLSISNQALTLEGLNQQKDILENEEANLAFESADQDLLNRSKAALVTPLPFTEAELWNLASLTGVDVNKVSKSMSYKSMLLFHAASFEYSRMNSRLERSRQSTVGWGKKLNSEIQKTKDEFTNSLNKMESEVDQFASGQVLVATELSTVNSRVNTPNQADRLELQKIEALLLGAKPIGIQAEKAKKLGLNAIEIADQASLAQDAELFGSAKQYAILMADIATGFIPVLGTARDAYEALTGENILTGDKLSDTERMLAAANAVMGVATMGGSKVVASSIKAAEASIGQALKVASKLSKTIQTELKIIGETTEAWTKTLGALAHVESKSGIKAQRILVGKNTENISIIGQDMKRVQEYKSTLEKAAREQGVNIKVHVFDNISDAAKDNFKLLTENGTKWLTPKEYRETKIFAENKLWIKKAKVESYNIIDLGKANSFRESAAYEMEVNSAFGKVR